MICRMEERPKNLIIKNKLIYCFFRSKIFNFIENKMKKMAFLQIIGFFFIGKYYLFSSEWHL